MRRLGVLTPTYVIALVYAETGRASTSYGVAWCYHEARKWLG